MSQDLQDVEPRTFVETALELGGKSREESQRTGRLDRADDQVEALFAPRYQTSQSPVHRAIWDREFPLDLFYAKPTDQAAGGWAAIMDESLALVRRHRDEGTLLDDHKKISAQVLDDLGKAGYWGLLVDPAYGGQGVPFTAF